MGGAVGVQLSVAVAVVSVSLAIGSTTGAWAQNPSCGDGVCGADEPCGDCAEDCGACEPDPLCACLASVLLAPLGAGLDDVSSLARQCRSDSRRTVFEGGLALGRLNFLGELVADCADRGLRFSGNGILEGRVAGRVSPALPLGGRWQTYVEPGPVHRVGLEANGVRTAFEIGLASPLAVRVVHLERVDGRVDVGLEGASSLMTHGQEAPLALRAKLVLPAADLEESWVEYQTDSALRLGRVEVELSGAGVYFPETGCHTSSSQRYPLSSPPQNPLREGCLPDRMDVPAPQCGETVASGLPSPGARLSWGDALSLGAGVALDDSGRLSIWSGGQTLRPLGQSGLALGDGGMQVRGLDCAERNCPVWVQGGFAVSGQNPWFRAASVVFQSRGRHLDARVSGVRLMGVSSCAKLTVLNRRARLSAPVLIGGGGDSINGWLDAHLGPGVGGETELHGIVVGIAQLDPSGPVERLVVSALKSTSQSPAEAVRVPARGLATAAGEPRSSVVLRGGARSGWFEARLDGECDEGSAVDCDLTTTLGLRPVRVDSAEAGPSGGSVWQFEVRPTTPYVAIRLESRLAPQALRLWRRGEPETVTPKPISDDYRDPLLLVSGGASSDRGAGDPYSALLILRQPLPGLWRLHARSLSPDADLSAWAPQASPHLALTSPGEGETSEEIRWTAGDPDSTAQLALVARPVGSSGAGVPIALPPELALERDREEVLARPVISERLEPGSYRVYGVLDDGVAPPVWAEAPGILRVMREDSVRRPAPEPLPPAPEANHGIRLSWIRANDDAHGYRIYLATPRGNRCDHLDLETAYALDLAAPTDSFLLPVGQEAPDVPSGYPWDRTVCWSVAALIPDGASPASRALLLDLTLPEGGGSNRPPSIITATLPPAVVGSVYSTQIETHDVDGDAISLALVSRPESGRAPPPALTLDQDGLLRWAPAPQQADLLSIAIEVVDAREGRADRSFELRVLERRETNPDLRWGKSEVTCAPARVALTFHDAQETRPSVDVSVESANGWQTRRLHRGEARFGPFTGSVLLAPADRPGEGLAVPDSGRVRARVGTAESVLRVLPPADDCTPPDPGALGELCELDGDCESGMTCHAGSPARESGYCTAACTRAAECQAPVDGGCAPSPIGPGVCVMRSGGVQAPGGLCAPCVFDSDCGGPEDLCLSLGAEYRGCGVACGPDGCLPGYRCGSGQCIPLGGSCPACSGRTVQTVCIDGDLLATLDECEHEVGRRRCSLEGSRCVRGQCIELDGPNLSAEDVAAPLSVNESGCSTALHTGRPSTATAAQGPVAAWFFRRRGGS